MTDSSLRPTFPVDLGDLAYAVDVYAHAHRFKCTTDAFRTLLQAGLDMARAKAVARG